MSEEEDTIFNWVGDVVSSKNNRNYYSGFKLGKLVVKLNDNVLIGNQDAEKPESPKHCFIAKVLQLYEKANHSTHDNSSCQFYATVQWYSRASDVSEKYREYMNDPDPEQELLLCYFKSTDGTIDAETIFGLCSVVYLDTNVTGRMFCATFDNRGRPMFFCRYSYFVNSSLKSVTTNEVVLGKRRKSNFSNSFYEEVEVGIEEMEEKSPKRSTRTSILKASNPSSRNTKSTEKSNKTPKRLAEVSVKPTRSKKKEKVTRKLLLTDSDSDFEDQISESLNISKRRTVKSFSENDQTSKDKKIQMRHKSPSKNNTVTPLKIRLNEQSVWESKKSPRFENKLSSKRIKRKDGKSAKPKSKRRELKSTIGPLPCRESEFQEIFSFIKGKLNDECGGCMYISGVPGTGKTATIRQVISILKDGSQELPDYKLIEINAMNLTSPNQCYVSMLKQLTGQIASADCSAKILREHFNHQSESDAVVVLVVDELDLLWTTKQDVIYNLFDWPSKPNAKVIVLAIANTMDLPERLMMNRVSSRLGLTRMTFHPYTHQQLQQIVKASMEEEVNSGFSADALQLVSRKVAAVSGDARRALEIWKRAKEISEEDGDSQGKIQLLHVDKAIQEMFMSPKILSIRTASLQEQTLLRAIVSEFSRTGVEESIFAQVYSQHVDICHLEGYLVPNQSQLSSVCSRLQSIRLLLITHGKDDWHQRIRLNVSTDDINYALQIPK